MDRFSTNSFPICSYLWLFVVIAKTFFLKFFCSLLTVSPAHHRSSSDVNDASNFVSHACPVPKNLMRVGIADNNIPELMHQFVTVFTKEAERDSDSDSNEEL